MSIKITADSTCDLSPELLARYDITLAPLAVIMDGKSYLDGIEITPQDIFAHVEKGGALCSTSAVNVDGYRELFSRYAGEYDDVIHISLGSLFSACYQNASIAAAHFPNVHVVNSMNLSTGQGHLAIEAAQLAREGVAAMEICSRLNAMRNRVQASFILDRLDYMQKGGRCSSVVALGGKLLKIKPCIEVRSGAMEPSKKYRGGINSVIRAYVKDRLCDRTDIEQRRIFITHTRCDSDVVDAVRELIQSYCPDMEEIIETTAGATITTHCGSETLGVLFIRKEAQP